MESFKKIVQGLENQHQNKESRLKKEVEATVKCQQDMLNKLLVDCALLISRLNLKPFLLEINRDFLQMKGQISDSKGVCLDSRTETVGYDRYESTPTICAMTTLEMRWIRGWVDNSRLRPKQKFPTPVYSRIIISAASRQFDAVNQEHILYGFPETIKMQYEYYKKIVAEMKPGLVDRCFLNFPKGGWNLDNDLGYSSIDVNDLPRIKIIRGEIHNKLAELIHQNPQYFKSLT